MVQNDLCRCSSRCTRSSSGPGPALEYCSTVPGREGEVQQVHDVPVPSTSDRQYAKSDLRQLVVPDVVQKYRQSLGWGPSGSGDGAHRSLGRCPFSLGGGGGGGGVPCFCGVSLWCRALFILTGAHLTPASWPPESGAGVAAGEHNTWGTIKRHPVFQRNNTREWDSI